MSPLRFRDVQCRDCGHTEELFRRDEDFDGIKARLRPAKVVCSSCGSNELIVLPSTPRSKLEGITGAFPSAADRWANVHEQAAKVGAKRNAGKYDDPNYHK